MGNVAHGPKTTLKLLVHVQAITPKSQPIAQYSVFKIERPEPPPPPLSTQPLTDNTFFRKFNPF